MWVLEAPGGASTMLGHVNALTTHRPESGYNKDNEKV